MVFVDPLVFIGSSLIPLCTLLNHLQNGLLSTDRDSDLQEESTSKIDAGAEWKYGPCLCHELCKPLYRADDHPEKGDTDGYTQLWCTARTTCYRMANYLIIFANQVTYLHAF